MDRMTDGIIQQAFKKIIPTYSARAADEINTSIDAKEVSVDLQLLQQELIEKIKKEFQSWTRGKLDGGSGGSRSMDWYSIQDFKQKLIGDNKE